MRDEANNIVSETVAKQRKPRAPKKKEHSKTALMLAVAIILAAANLILLVKLGYQLR